jgi:hypothetical protein
LYPEGAAVSRTKFLDVAVVVADTPGALVKPADYMVKAHRALASGNSARNNPNQASLFS